MHSDAVDDKMNESTVHSGSRKDQPDHGVHQAQYYQPVEGGDCPTLL